MDEVKALEVKKRYQKESDPEEFSSMYEFVKFIGEGAYSEVIEAISKKHRNRIAIKVCFITNFHFRRATPNKPIGL
jgi:hypothetical protein